MPFGLCNAVSMFQRMMNRILAGLPFIFVYLVLVASPDHASHRQHLQCFNASNATIFMRMV